MKVELTIQVTTTSLKKAKKKRLYIYRNGCLFKLGGGGGEAPKGNFAQGPQRGQGGPANNPTNTADILTVSESALKLRYVPYQPVLR